MDHTPNAAEQALIAGLLEQFAFEPVPVRLTDTMLKKSIIDATDPLRALLRRAGLVDYAAMPQGEAGKVTLEVPFASAKAAERRTTSFYRPTTKKGDPRFWISKLPRDARPGDLLIMAFAGAELVAILLRGSLDSLARKAGTYLPRRFEERGRSERSVATLLDRLAPITGRWIRTKRAGPTGIGYTLETLLDLEANVRQDADFEGVELKAYRRGAEVGPGKLVSLFAKTPQWMGVARTRGLLREFGYFDAERGRRALYCTITKSTNTLGWSLQVDGQADRILVAYRGDPKLEYSLKVLEKRLQEKHPATLFVKASSRGTGAGEEFRYEEVVLCRQPSLANLLSLIEQDLVGLDFTAHERANGTARDHGYLWRIREHAIPELFAYRRVLATAE